MTYIHPKPKTDAQFLDTLSEIIFIAGFKFELVRQRWPLIRKAFHMFKVEKVANETVERMLKKDGMIRNKSKIAAVIQNAKLCMELRKEHGGVMKWVSSVERTHRKDPLFSPTVREEMQRFEKIGKETSRWMVYVCTRDKMLLNKGEKG